MYAPFKNYSIKTKLGSRRFCDSGYSDSLSTGPFDLAKAQSL